MNALIRALKAAREEFYSALYFEDWAERRNIFAAMELFEDVVDDPDEMTGYDAAHRRLVDLNHRTYPELWDEDGRYIADRITGSPSATEGE